MLSTLASLVCIANISKCMQPEQAVVKKPFTPDQADVFTQGARRGRLQKLESCLKVSYHY